MPEDKKKVKLDYSVTQNDIDRAYELAENHGWDDIGMTDNDAVEESTEIIVWQARDLLRNINNAQNDLSSPANYEDTVDSKLSWAAYWLRHCISNLEEAQIIKTLTKKGV